MNTLPDKPSALIRVALADLAKVEAMPETFKIDMDTFFAKPEEGYRKKCTVCLAGSVMAISLHCPHVLDLEPGDFTQRLDDQLEAINWFRVGQIGDAFSALGLGSAYGEDFDRDIVDYHDKPKKFRKQMAKLADDLEAAGY